MINNYKWRDLKNAVGWAHECARLAKSQSPYVEPVCPSIITHAARAAAHAANAANAPNARACIDYTYAAASAADGADVSQFNIDQAQFAAIASDLGLAPGTENYHAACAALAIGNIELAREIAGL